MEFTSAPIPPLSSRDHVRGPETAPLVVFYGDFTCPRCALAHERLSGQPLRVAFRHFALRAKHPRAQPLAQAAEAAASQGAFWAFHDALMTDQSHNEDPDLWALAQRLGLDVTRLDAERRSPAVQERVADDVRGALRAGVTVTPTLFSGASIHPGVPAREWLQTL